MCQFLNLDYPAPAQSKFQFYQGGYTCDGCRECVVTANRVNVAIYKRFCLKRISQITTAICI